MSTFIHNAVCFTLVLAAGFPSGARAEALLTPIRPYSTVRTERTPVVGGGELYTFFKSVPDPSGEQVQMEVPFVSILRDTMGDADPENDVLRDVWALTGTRPGVWRRVAGAVPFFYHRTPSARPSEKSPVSLIDLASPANGTWPRVLGTVAQSFVFDGRGLPFRATSRAYRGRVREYRDMQLAGALELLSREQAGQDLPAQEELEFVRGRVLLASNLFGGYVADRYVAPAWRKFNMSVSEARGHNWELLRQRAEENGLYFQPLELAPGLPSFAMLWMEQSRAGARAKKFDSKFLSISDPFRDARIARWKNYSETWQFDEYGSRVVEGTGAREARMIPLGLYSLEHPRVPLLIVDFRDSGKPKRREMLRRATDDIATGVLGLTGFGNAAWFTFRTTASFLHSRRVAPLDRSARVRAYVQMRQALSTDTHLPPELRDELLRRLEKLGMNPFDNASRAEMEIARTQHRVLIERAGNGGLERHLSRQRISEAEQILHSQKSRVLRRIASVASAGIYRHREPETSDLLHAVDRQRRLAHHRNVIEHAMASGPQPEITADMERVRRSVEMLTELVERDDPENLGIQHLLTRLLLATRDEQTRARCYAGLQRLGNPVADVASTHEGFHGAKTSSGEAQ